MLLHLILLGLWTATATEHRVDGNGTGVERPGALVQGPRKLSLFRSAVSVTLNCSHLPDSLQALHNLSQALPMIQDNMRKLQQKEPNNSKIPESLLMNWQGKLEAVDDILGSVLTKARPQYEGK